ncbi:hypothetical protein K2173_024938 [Erythroxylum novogranatense]|uniref:LNK2 n=1 Tax=Erythroxylum novogranatense TaxID=1862640 RepID=A0AAV8UFI3_9ROSI|nr:hypothetical protein K2173_024938 [Erythroxylum novogranatense]
MFDWNDEELDNIIWGEVGEGGDRIVPYPEARDGYSGKKEWSDKDGNVKSTGRKQSTAKVDLHGTNLESSSNFEISEGISASGSGIDSWSNLSLTNATAKTDQESLDASVSVDLTDIAKVDSSGEIAELDNMTAMFQNPQEGKELGNFIDYGWANIGSFDDLNRIFSNDDPIFGNGSLANADELWSSSKDVTNNPVKSFPLSLDSPNSGLGPLRNTSEHLGIKTEYLHEDDQPFTLGHGELNDPIRHGPWSSRKISDHVRYTGNTELTNRGRNSSTNCQLASEKEVLSSELAAKVQKQKKLLRSRKNLEENSLYQDLHSNWFSFGASSTQLKNQNADPILRSSSSTVPSQQKQLQGADSLQYHQICNSFFASSAYGQVASPCTAMPLMSHIQSREFKPQPLLSGYETSSSKTNPVSEIAHSSGRHTMTPQEKIEKLRRRQQMQAHLAIQKQQLKFVHQVNCCGQPVPRKCSQENEMSNAEGACLANIEFDELSSLSAFDDSSPIEQDESSTISLVDSAEDTVLFQLEEIIAKLDVRTRLCIRDSLFRLAQSALQRQDASDTSRINNSGRDEQGVKEETSGHNRNSDIPEEETKTNPSDRTVARLLFHRPFEFSRKHSGRSESSVSTELSKYKSEGIAKPSASCLQDTIKLKQNLDGGSENSFFLSDPRSIIQCKTILD